jgi:hypothetical protein
MKRDEIEARLGLLTAAIRELAALMTAEQAAVCRERLLVRAEGLMPYLSESGKRAALDEGLGLVRVLDSGRSTLG